MSSSGICIYGVKLMIMLLVPQEQSRHRWLHIVHKSFFSLGTVQKVLDEALKKVNLLGVVGHATRG